MIYLLCQFNTLTRQLGLPLRLMLKNEPFSPSFWRSKHGAVVDMQRQCGHPQFFRTRAPYERTFPYHVFIMDSMMKTGRPRLHSAVLETFHMAWVLKELDRGVLIYLSLTRYQQLLANLYRK